ncbi:hypothetical protein SpCBS45565_g00359 [Spizellomyces sp. 'palustris']|nr:hypothetical protein SpCBS45565_g00359 [Spizellomyces sp. 'palustris']
MVHLRRIIVSAFAVGMAITAPTPVQAGVVSTVASSLVELAVERVAQMTLRPNLNTMSTKLTAHMKAETLPKIVDAAIVDLKSHTGVDVSGKIDVKSLVDAQTGELTKRTEALKGTIEDAFVLGIKNAGIVKSLTTVTEAMSIKTWSAALKKQATDSINNSVQSAVATWYNATVLAIYDDVTKSIAPQTKLKRQLTRPLRLRADSARSPQDQILDVLNVATMLALYTLFFPVAIIVAPIAALISIITGGASA